jgi:hypothetical protein
MSKEDSENLVSVYKTDNPALIALVKSMLDEAGIQYMAKDDDVASIVPINAFPVDFMVMPEDADYARELLKDVESSEEIEDNENPSGEEEEN